VFKVKYMNKKSKFIATSALLTVIAQSFLFVSSAQASSTCRLKVSTGAIEQYSVNYCNSRADVSRPDPNAEKGDPGWIPYFFENPDECDLGLSFPDLIPDISVDLKKINSCELLKAASQNAVNQVNKRFSEIEGDVKDLTGGDITEEIDLGKEIDRRVNNDGGG